MDKFIEIAVWLTIAVLVFNQFAIWFDGNTVNSNLKLGLDPENTSLFGDDEDFYLDVSGQSTITSTEQTSPQASQDRLDLLFISAFNGIYNVFFAWERVLSTVFTNVVGGQLMIIKTMLTVIIGFIEVIGLLALVSKIIQTIGSILPFT